MKSVILQDPNTGEFIKQDATEMGASAAPRSWVEGGQDGAYDFKFVTEDGATVKCRYLSEADVPGAKQEQGAILDQSLVVQNNSRTFSDLMKDPTNSMSSSDMKRLEEELMKSSKALRVRQARLSREVVNKCVLGWEKAPIPFSPEALAKLPIELCIEWSPIIINNSELSEEEANFLADSSPTGATTDS